MTFKDSEGDKMKYEGEIDKDGKACGVGIVSLAKDPN